VHLDRELRVQALAECLHLLDDLQYSPQSFREICPQLRLRLSFVLLHDDRPEFQRAEIRKLAAEHNQLATSLLRAQRLQALLNQSSV
jgi:hypothetical protein